MFLKNAGKHTGCKCLSMVYVYGSVVGVKGSFWEDCPLCHGLSDFLFCSVALLWTLVLQNGGKHTGCEFLSMVYFYGSVVGVKGLFWEDYPLYHWLSDFLVLLLCCGRWFCKLRGNTQAVCSCPWYTFMDLWLG